MNIFSMTDGQTDGQMDGRMDDGRTDGTKKSGDGWMDGWKKKIWGWMDGWIYELILLNIFSIIWFNFNNSIIINNYFN